MKCKLIYRLTVKSSFAFIFLLYMHVWTISSGRKDGGPFNSVPSGGRPQPLPVKRCNIDHIVGMSTLFFETFFTTFMLTVI